LICTSRSSALGAGSATGLTSAGAATGGGDGVGVDVAQPLNATTTVAARQIDELRTARMGQAFPSGQVASIVRRTRERAYGVHPWKDRQGVDRRTLARMATDPFDLQRFVDAQARVYPEVTAELAAGQKTSHWMWFVFPQLKGLGRSATALHFGLASLDEARAYWSHPLLGARLAECGRLLLALPAGRSAQQVLGAVDALKLCSCLTLFERAAPQEPLFGALLDRFYGGQRDAATLALL
jgi:uncharacterized protein (DUF1810 family)